jgi:hypothetical protein
MRATEVTIPIGDITLAGTYTTPDRDGPFPAALLIAGSGPLDRDGNHKRLPLGVSKALAEILVEAGWASLRYDKRGIGASGGDYMTTGFKEEGDDARSALEWLIDRSDTSTIVPIGHSVGALYAAEMSAFSPGVDGTVLLAYTAKTGRETLEWQAGAIGETLPGIVTGLLKVFRSSVQNQQAKAIRRLEGTTRDVTRVQGQKVNARWMREFIAYDPEPALRATKTPILAITGTKDVQVDATDLNIVASTVGNRAEVHIVDDLDHILRHEGSPVSNPKKYKSQITGPIEWTVTSVILAWLERLLADTSSE